MSFVPQHMVVFTITTYDYAISSPPMLTGSSNTTRSLTEYFKAVCAWQVTSSNSPDMLRTNTTSSPSFCKLLPVPMLTIMDTSDQFQQRVISFPLFSPELTGKSVQTQSRFTPAYTQPSNRMSTPHSSQTDWYLVFKTALTSDDHTSH